MFITSGSVGFPYGFVDVDFICQKVLLFDHTSAVVNFPLKYCVLRKSIVGSFGILKNTPKNQHQNSNLAFLSFLPTPSPPQRKLKTFSLL